MKAGKFVRRLSCAGEFVEVKDSGAVPAVTCAGEAEALPGPPSLVHTGDTTADPDGSVAAPVDNANLGVLCPVPVALVVSQELAKLLAVEQAKPGKGRTVS